MVRLTRRPLRTAALLATGLVVAGAAAVPWAGASPKARPAAGSQCTTADLPVARTLVERALDRRVARLEVLGARVDSAKLLSTGDRATLTSTLAAQLAGIKTLQAKVPGDSDCTALVADAQAMVTTYRVFTVTSPQVHITIAADTETAIVAGFSALEPTIAARISAAQAKGVTVSAAQATDSDLVAQVASAAQASGGIASSALAITPADFSGSHQAFEADASALGTGRTALEQARTDLQALKADARAEAKGRR